MDLVAIYHCGRQTDAAPAEVLSRFRDKYPACAVVMINDGGDKVMESYAKMFHCEYAPCSNVSRNPSCIELGTAYDAIKYVDRLLAAVPDHDGWVLLLEDDVWIYDQVVLTQLRYDMCGGRGLALSPSVCMDISCRRENFPRKGVPSVKSGGAFLRASFLRAMRGNDTWRKNVNLLFLEEGRSFFSGTLLSILVYMEGGTVGPYPGYFEPEFLSFKLFAAMGQGVLRYRCKILGNQRKIFSRHAE